VCNSQQSCKCNMGGVSHLGQTTSEAERPVQRVGLSFTHWGSGTELVVLTPAHRGCFCDRCAGILRAGARTLIDSCEIRWGPYWDSVIEQDVFYHEVENYFDCSSRILEGTCGVYPEGPF